MSKVIIPEVNRNVHFIPGDADRAVMVAIGIQPLHAVVLYVHNERSVNLSIIDHVGNRHTRQSVQLAQEGDAVADGTSYCRWMQYQLQQAKPPITEADALADLAGTPRPDNPTVAASDGIVSPVLADLLATTATSLKPEDLAGVKLGADGTPASSEAQS